MRHREGGHLLCVIGDEDTVTGFLLSGIGEIDQRRNPNFFVVDSETPAPDIESAFKRFVAREDVAILLINQDWANLIRHLLDEYTQLFPTIVEIPSKANPYDVTKDSLMSRVKRLTGKD